MTIAEPLKQTDDTEKQDLLRIELLIAQWLRVGVVTSFLILAVGIGALMATGQSGYDRVRLDDLNSLVGYHAGSPAYPNSLGDIARGVLEFKPYAIIALGLLVLIAIPVMRVAVSVVAFALEGDRLYMFITAFVLAMLLLSFLIGETGG